MEKVRNPSNKTGVAILICGLFFFIAFLSFIVLHEKKVKKLAADKVSTHGQVVSTSLWTYEKSTPTNYLSLAINANDYQHVTVKDDQGEIFLQLEGAPLSTFESFLISLKLISSIQFTEEILFEGSRIGTIEVSWLSKSIYLYFYILFCIILLFIGVTLLLKLFEANQLLELRVKQRTAELEKEVQEHKVTAKELQLQAQRLSMHIKHTPLGVIEWSPDFKVIDWNNAAKEIFGFSKEDIIGRNPLNFLVPNNEKANVESIWEQLIKNTGGISSINTNLTKSGKIKTCSWYNTNLTNSDGELIGLASLVLDITEQVETEKKNKQLHQQLLQAQKMEAVGNLAGGIAHDFNNILQSISGYTQLLMMKAKQKREDCTKLEKIDTASQRAAVLIKKLLTFSRGMESRLIPINLNQEIDNIQGVLDRTFPKMVTINKRLDPELLLINGDSIQLEQIILNLAINANHAMPNGGELLIETCNIELDEIFCNKNYGATVGKNVLLTVSDTGVGMSKEVMERIFEPFFTTRDIGKGTGLGLATVYGIVNEHKAYITCSSEQDKGTTFQIYFPATANQQQIDKKEPASQKEAPPGGSETILLVDDEQTIREIGEQILVSYGYRTILAQNGEQAIKLFKEQKNRIDLIVMDLNMPEMGGQQCIAKLNDMDHNVPILVASGYIPPDTAKRLKDLNVTGTISKPFELNNLLKELRKALDNQ